MAEPLLVILAIQDWDALPALEMLVFINGTGFVLLQKHSTNHQKPLI